VTGYLSARTCVQLREYSATWLRSLIDDVAAMPFLLQTGPRYIRRRYCLLG
jgi:hypothetical protein